MRVRYTIAYLREVNTGLLEVLVRLHQTRIRKTCVCVHVRMYAIYDTQTHKYTIKHIHALAYISARIMHTCHAAPRRAHTCELEPRNARSMQLSCWCRGS